MFLKPLQIAPDRASALLAAAETAARAIPPAFPLSATVAVNPFLGLPDPDLATAAARMARVAGIPMTRPRAQVRAEIAQGKITDDDLAAALIACRSALKPADLALLKARIAIDSPAPQRLPTVADLAAQATGTDWPAIIARSLGLWAAGRFDLGQALWTPAPGQAAFAAWRDWAIHDLTPGIAGLAGFCAHVAAAPDTPDRALLRAADRLGLTEAAAETAFHRLLVDLGGWAQHARWLLWEAELQGATDHTLADLLAIRLIWEEALLAHLPQLAADWEKAVAAHAQPPQPTPDMVIDAILQEAAERAHQRDLAARLDATAARPAPAQGRPALQAAFCIDVRSEVIRRALEAQDPSIRTIGFAGFFGLPLTHRPHGSDLLEPHLPVLLSPKLVSTGQDRPDAEAQARIAARATRAWGRFRQAAVSSFAFVEAAGPAYGWKLLRDSLQLGETETTDPAPRFETALDAETRIATAAAVLKAMSMTSGFARLVLLLGHGATVTNNPLESAYHCGACGGQTGEVSARLLADLLNDPIARAGLGGRGIDLPADTVFVAGLHDTTTDRVTLYADSLSAEHQPDLAQARDWLAAAGAATRAERAPRLPGATPQDLLRRAADWAETRPEWGLAGCAAFIAAPRAATAGADLRGRAFLHSYDWKQDAGLGTLELILTAPVVVASWISLQYYGSTVAPDLFGGGNKLLHNVVGGIGVVQGNGGVLRPGLPLQAVHDGERPVHDALRLSVLIEAPVEEMSRILDRHPQVAALFDRGWLHLFALDGGRMAARYRPGGSWEPLAQTAQAAA